MFEKFFGNNKKDEPTPEGSYRKVEQPETATALRVLLDARPDDLGPNAGEEMDKMIAALDEQAEKINVAVQAQNGATGAQNEPAILDRVQSRVSEVPKQAPVEPVLPEARNVNPYAAPEASGPITLKESQVLYKEADAPRHKPVEKKDVADLGERSANRHGFKEVK
jgi:hypothetical protein